MREWLLYISRVSNSHDRHSRVPALSSTASGRRGRTAQGDVLYTWGRNDKRQVPSLRAYQCLLTAYLTFWARAGSAPRRPRDACLCLSTVLCPRWWQLGAASCALEDNKYIFECTPDSRQRYAYLHAHRVSTRFLARQRLFASAN